MKQSLGRGLEQKLRNIPSTSTEDGIAVGQPVGSDLILHKKALQAFT